MAKIQSTRSASIISLLMSHSHDVFEDKDPLAKTVAITHHCGFK
jgi:hypothetical protein